MSKNSFIKKIRFFSVLAGFFLGVSLITGCYSVFSGGTGGLVVDSESTNTPKSGIANVDVYAYTDGGARDRDFSSYKEGTVFKPSAAYYGHTSTGADGSFTLSKIVWKSFNPAFGKDADTSTIYLIFYHENYGLTLGATLIVSDSTSDTVYQELTKVRKTTALNILLKDVATEGAVQKNVHVKVTVPQSTETNPDLPSKVYNADITGQGIINVSYPRWQNNTLKEENTETEPEIIVQYYQSAAEVEWKGCKNGGESGDDYSFLEDGFSIKQKIKNENYSVIFYGKACVFNVPVVRGQYVGTKDEKDDGLQVEMKAAPDGTNFTKDCGSVYTDSQNLGTSEKEKHGVFEGLGNGTWKNSSYTGKTCSLPIKLTVKDPLDNSEKATLQTTVLSNQTNLTLNLK